MLEPTTAYDFLISLYCYADVAFIVFLVSGGLLYLKLDSFIRGENGRNEAENVAFVPWLSLLHVIIYFLAIGFCLFATFTPLASTSVFTPISTHLLWYILPMVGLSSDLWGVVWWCGMKGLQRSRRRRLVVRRTAYIERDDDGSYVQKAELGEHGWLMDLPPY